MICVWMTSILMVGLIDSEAWVHVLLNFIIIFILVSILG